MTSLLVPLRESGSRPALFLVHGGAGRAGVSSHFLEALGIDQPVYAFRAKGLDGLAAPHRHITEMAADYTALMRRVQPEGPYYVGAFCAGALVAHEMACQLRAAGQSLAPLLLLDPPPPPRRQGLPRFLAKLVALWLAVLMARTAGTRSILVWFRRRHMSSVQAKTSWPENHMRVWIRFRIAAFRHHLLAYDGPVHVIGSRQRLVEFQSGACKDYLTGDVQSFEVAHAHLDVFDPSNEQAAAYLKQCVETAQAWLARSSIVKP